MLQALHAPLPIELAGSGHGWFTRYRIWPVFSAAWARGRQRVFGLCAGALLLLMALLPMGRTPDELPIGGYVQVTAQLLLPLFIGPWLGVWVRRRGWAPAHEFAALVAAMLGLVLAILAFHYALAEPIKQAIAEATGRVDEQGRRKRVVMQIGVTVTTPDQAARAASAALPGGGLDRETQITNGIAIVLLTLWLGGGAALVGWRRERAGLAALAREREMARAQAARREAELKLSVLAAQVEPHFLFNTLAGVRSAIATDPARASEMIDRLVEYLRAAIPRLRSSGDSEATLGGQLEIVRAYLALMAARMPRLAWRVQVAPELLALPCPPLMLISLAENAVKHGVEPKIGPVHVEIGAHRSDDGLLHVTVADDGAGFGASEAGSGLGLANIRERLQQMYPGRAALTLKARPEGGVAATLSLPIE